MDKIVRGKEEELSGYPKVPTKKGMPCILRKNVISKVVSKP